MSRETRFPRDDEFVDTATQLPAQVIASATDPAVYAMIVDLGGGVYAMTAHVVDGDGPRVFASTMTGRGGDNRTRASLVAEAKRNVAERVALRRERTVTP